MKETAGSSVTQLFIYRATWRHIPEVHNLHNTLVINVFWNSYQGHFALVYSTLDQNQREEDANCLLSEAPHHRVINYIYIKKKLLFTTACSRHETLPQVYLHGKCSYRRQLGQKQ
jgi:hypothetical protein